MTFVPPTTSNTATAAVRLTAVELLAIAGTVHAGMLEAVAAVLAGGHVFDDLSVRDAKRVAGAIAFAPSARVARCQTPGTH